MALVDQYPGVIFDYGGVLVSHQTRQDIEKMASVARLPADVFEKYYWTDRCAYDKGLITAEDYWNDLAKRAQTSVSPEQIADLIEGDVESWIRFDPVMYEFADRLRSEGKRIAVLSNMPHELGQTIKTRTQGFEPFHHVTLSYEVRSIKPEREIYEHCLSGIGLRADETIFLDDRLENVEGARQLGIHAIQFTSPGEILPRLASNGNLGLG
jgi:putative hydrolase of the HAD superfamily